MALGRSGLQLLELPTRHMKIIHDKLGESFGKINTQIGIVKYHKEGSLCLEEIEGI